MRLMDRILPTPHVVLGPFYPVPPPGDAGADLLTREPPAGSGRKRLIEIVGRVLTATGHPIAGALVEIWHANGFGRYVHPGDASDVPSDPDFRGYGMQRSDEAGRYRFRTVKPGAYHDGHEMRAPHVHFQITGASDRLVTQLFFENEPLHHADWWFKNCRWPRRLEAPLEPVGDKARGVAFTLTWDIVLRCA
jgi:protocatechuate 3,4-dioxygenase beta subunit